MTVVDPETGEVTHQQDDPAVVATAADELCDATLAIEHVDFNALREDQLRDLLDAKATVSRITKELRRRQPCREG